jgi:CHAT domain-containing protein
MVMDGQISLAAISLSRGRSDKSSNSIISNSQSHKAVPKDLQELLNLTARTAKDDPQLALANYLSIFETSRRVLGQNHAFTLLSLSAIGDVIPTLSTVFADKYRTETISMLQRALEIYRPLALANLEHKISLASTLQELKRYMNVNFPDDLYEEKIETLRQLAAEDGECSRSNTCNVAAFTLDLAWDTSQLAGSYFHSERHKSEFLLKESIALYERLAYEEGVYFNQNNQLLGANVGRREIFFSEYASALRSYGWLQRKLGNISEALPPLYRAYQIYKELARSNAVYTMDIVEMLAETSTVQRLKGDLAISLRDAQEGVELARKREFRAHGDMIIIDEMLSYILITLGEAYEVLGNYEQALIASSESLDILQNLKVSHPDSDYAPLSLPSALIRVSAINRRLARHSQSLALGHKAIDLLRKLANDKPVYIRYLADGLANLAMSEMDSGNSARALPLIDEMMRIGLMDAQKELPNFPAFKREHILANSGRYWEIPFLVARESEASRNLAMFTRLNRQGLLLDIQRKQTLSARNSEAIYKRLVSAMSKVADARILKADRERLLLEIQDLEEQLYRVSPEFKPKLVEPSEIASHIPANGLLVEFQRYQDLLPELNQLSSLQYMALLLKPDGSIRVIPLGSSEPIDSAIAEAVAASSDPKRQAEAPDRLAVVSHLLLKPLQAELSGVRELFVSPDGELNRLPFGALPMAASTGPTLGESVQLRLLTTGRELVRLQQPATSGNASTLITNPDFGPADPSVKNPWQPLPGTVVEGEKLLPLLRPQAVISGQQATTSLVLKQKSPRILHIATHGFFLANEPGQNQGTQGFEVLQRSGLVFAGANQRVNNFSDDGLLTAAEASAMDLNGTELVTLSACETALGTVRRGEGVYGLQRALAVAGARSTLLSLWKVEDIRTATFLTRYYEKLKAGEGRADALRNTQAEYRKSNDSNLNDVRVWGAFQLSGDWRPIPGW